MKGRIINMSNEFVVNTEVMAKAILCLTEIKFKKFINKDGNTRYSFPRDEKVFKAYTYIQDFKQNN